MAEKIHFKHVNEKKEYIFGGVLQMWCKSALTCSPLHLGHEVEVGVLGQTCLQHMLHQGHLLHNHTTQHNHYIPLMFLNGGSRVSPGGLQGALGGH